MTYQLHHGDCISIMPLIERESVDAIVTDPPYGLGFMGKDWDHGVPGMHFWLEALRCAKPGAHLLAFGGTRTFHRLAVAIEDAGWEIRDCVMWVYGSGFPKSHDVSKAIDREAGAEREVIGRKMFADGTMQRATARAGIYSDEKGQAFETSPATPAAAEWDGWGTALKPAWEPIIVARKPLQGTVAENVQRYGTGAMNIDGCRIETGEALGRISPGIKSISRNVYEQGARPNFYYADQESRMIDNSADKGRWPANLIHDGSAEVLAGFPMTTSGGKAGLKMDRWTANGRAGIAIETPSPRDGDTGSAARFFYCAKASKQDRDEGCEGLDQVIPEKLGMPNDPEYLSTDGVRRSGYRNAVGNHHPTVKPTALMRYLCRLVTPPNGVILDSFMGSGSTGKAAMLEGFNFIGIDTEIEYVEIAARRIEHACEKVGIVVEQPMMFETKRETVDRPKQLMLL